MAPRKKKTTRPKKVTANNKTAPLFFIGLIIAAVAGWYISFTYTTPTPPNTKTTNTVSQKRSTPLNKEIPLVIPQKKITPPSLQNELTQLNQLPKTKITPQPQAPIPLKKELPFFQPTPPANKNIFADSQTTQDSARKIFVQKQTIIYQEPTTSSKQVAIVERGQELRSYNKQGNWHKITVPRAGIIGWVLDSSFMP